MKKLFSKIETKIDPSTKESKGGQSLVGKVFQIGKQNSVTVEDIIAEGRRKIETYISYKTIITYYK